MFDCWRELAHRRGLPGLFIGTIKQYEFPVPEVLKHFDAVMQFQPFEALYSPDYPRHVMETAFPVRMARHLLPEKALDWLRHIRYQYFPRLEFYDYEEVWTHILKVEREGGIPAFPGAFVDWDNTARYVKRARIFRGASPERFEHYFRQLVHITAQRPHPERMIFINAWNEWAESAYLEPDERHGMAYLEAVKRSMESVNADAARAERAAAD